MSKKLKNNVIAIGVMVVLSIGIIVGTKFANGDFGPKDNRVALNVDGFTSNNATISEAYRLLGEEDETAGYSVTVSSTGFNTGTPIVMKVTFDAAKTNVTGFEVLEQDETTGLGANITTEEFTSQFAGKTAPVYTGDMSAIGTAFDQVSGATMSSKAVAHGINAAAEYLETVQ